MLPLFYHTRRRHGFTLVELLVVVLILAILLSVALPLYTAAIADAEKKAARTNMQTIANAMAAFKIRDLNHQYPKDYATLVAGGDISNITGPGTRTYTFVLGDGSTTCFTPNNQSGTVQDTSVTIPQGNFAIESVQGTTTSGQSANDDGCYIPGISIQ